MQIKLFRVLVIFILVGLVAFFYSNATLVLARHISTQVETPKPAKTPKPIKTPRPTPTPKPTKTPRPTPTPLNIPFAKVLYPNGGETFTEGDVITIKWETKNVTSCFLGYTIGPGTLDWILFNFSPNITSHEWTVLNWGNSGSPRPTKIDLGCYPSNSNASFAEDQSDDFFIVNPKVTPTPSPTPTPTPIPATFDAAFTYNSANGSARITADKPIRQCYGAQSNGVEAHLALRGYNGWGCVDGKCSYRCELYYAPPNTPSYSWSDISAKAVSVDGEIKTFGNWQYSDY